MRFQSLVYGIVGVALAAVAVSAGQAGDDKATRLRNPAMLTETAPASYTVNLNTNKGVIVIQVHRDWAPNAADRLYNLVKAGFYDEARFFRVVPNFMVQFGMSADPVVTRAWRSVQMKDEPTKMGNKKGYVTFARTSAPNSRGTQLFINYKDNSFLDAQGFAAVGEVTKGMEIAEGINAQYGEKPNQAEITAQGNAYLMKEFPKLDFIKTATIGK